MSHQDTSASDRTAAALALLQPVAEQVNKAAEELAKPVKAIDAALKQMSIGFGTWTNVKSGGEQPEFWTWDIGYARVKKRWGICLRVASGNENYPHQDVSEEWHFNEAPLYLRHPAIDKLPDLLEALAKTGATVAGKLTRATERATTIAEIVTPKAKK